MGLVIAIIVALWYYVNMFRIGYHFTYAFGSPIVLGLICGVLYGDVAQGLIIGANIQLVYLGVIVAGGNLPSDQCLAASVAIPIALANGLDVTYAVGLAVPFGVLGVFLDQIKRTSNIYWLHKADKFAEVGDDKGIFRCAFTYPLLTAFLYRFLPVFIIVWLGPNATSALLEVLPTWIVNGFAVAGGILPAMGIAMTLMVIGKKDLLPLFFIGFFLVKYLNLNMIATSIFGVCIAALYYLQKSKNGGEADV